MLEITVLAPEDSGISAAAGIKAELLSAVGKARPGSTIIFDISKAKRADSSLAQLMIAFERDAAVKGYKAVIKDGDAQRTPQTMCGCDSMEGRNEEVSHER